MWISSTKHLARYTFAARLSRGQTGAGRRGCGAGYGLGGAGARGADRVVGGGTRPPRPSSSRAAHYPLANLWFERGSCAALPHRDASFDLVVAFEVIEHLENWREFLLEARRVLTPGGQFIVSTPNRLY